MTPEQIAAMAQTLMQQFAANPALTTAQADLLAQPLIDGLGTAVAQFWSDFDNQNPARVIKWDGNDRRLDKQMTLKVNIIARRTMGLRFDEVEEFYNHLPTDPMGPASRYM